MILLVKYLMAVYLIQMIILENDSMPIYARIVSKQSGGIFMINAAVPSKNTASADIKHSRYFHKTSNFWSIHYCGKRLYVRMFHIVDTAFRY